MVLAHDTAPDMLVTTYLHMTSRDQLQAEYADEFGGSVRMERMQQPDVAFYRFLYSAVGEIWRWRDRHYLSNEELKAAIGDPNTSVYVMYVDGVPAGYVELVRRGGETEIAYFGIRPDFMGRGLGKHLLSYGIARAWDEGAQRVWVHTCNLDSPHALNNYMKRGMSIYDVHYEPMPERYA